MNQLHPTIPSDLQKFEENWLGGAVGLANEWLQKSKRREPPAEDSSLSDRIAFWQELSDEAATEQANVLSNYVRAVVVCCLSNRQKSERSSDTTSHNVFTETAAQ